MSGPGSGPGEPGDRRWRDRVWELFEAALELPDSERASFLSRHSDEPDLIAEVEGLIRGHAREGGILDRPAAPFRPEAGRDEELELEGRVRTAFESDYRLVRELGRGGMSRVYLAWERKHQRRVVLKVLRPEVAALHGSERFVREGTLIARLSHPNIIPLIDSGVREGLAYYVMPYIDGVTLRDRLRELGDGRMPIERVLPLLRDVAEALAFSHAAGVVHRDLKPDNVLLAGPHAYLFDFGIARAARLQTLDAAPVTREGAFLGTPGYAAPEQIWGGRPVDHRADLWAWGVLAWELFTGAPPPPPSGSHGDVARPDPAVLRARAPRVPAPLADLVVACLDPDPDRRPRDAAALLEGVGGSALPPVAPSRRVPLRVAAIAGVAVVVAVGARAVLAPSPEGTGAGEALALPVAVAPFLAETADSATRVLGRFASDWITQGLEGVDGIDVVPWPVSRAAGEIADEGGDVVTALARSTGAGTVVSGSVYDLGGRIRFRAEIVDARTGLVIAAPDPVSAPRDSAQAALTRLVDRVRTSVAIAADARLASIPGLAGRPPSFDAYRVFDRAMDLYLAQDYAPASDAFEDAWLRDTSFHSALVYAAVTRLNAGSVEGADSLLERVRPHLDELATAERIRWEMVRAFVDGDAPRAYRATVRLAELGPVSRAPYNAARLAVAMNRPREARDLLRAADPDRGELRGWAQYWTQLAHALHLLGDFQGEAEAAAEMTRRYPERRVAGVLELRARGALGDGDAVEALLERAETLAPDTYWSAGAGAVVAAEALRAHGHPGWEAILERGRRWLDARLLAAPEHRGHRYWRASADFDARRWSEAVERFTALLEEVPDHDGYRGMLALALAHRGEVEGAETLLEGGFAQDPGGRIAYRARIAALEGDPDRASALLGQAFLLGVDGWAWMPDAGFDEFAPVAGDPRIQRLLHPEN